MGSQAGPVGSITTSSTVPGGAPPRPPVPTFSSSRRRDGLAFGHHPSLAVEHPSGVLAGDAEIQADDPAFCPSPTSCLVCLSGRPRWSAPSRHGPKVAAWRRPPLMCCKRPWPHGPGHFPHPGHPWPGQRWQSDLRGEGTVPSLRAAFVATPGPAGMLMQPRNRRSVVDPPPGVPYMRPLRFPLA